MSTAIIPHWKTVAENASNQSHKRYHMKMAANKPQKPNSESYTYATLFGNEAKPAVRAVFDTMELAEMILGEICMRDLLISVQRTCKQWKSIIDASYRLQEALFFRPINKKRLVYCGNTEDERISVVVDRKLIADVPEEASNPIYEHPIVTNKCSKIRKYNPFPARQAMDHPQASWRRQLITQPPLAELNWWYFEGDVRITKTVRASSSIGVTLGDFANGISLRSRYYHERWSWQRADWDHAPAVAKIEPARKSAYTEGQWVAE
ncbi:uncharacterized protein RCC_04237 [Ramularia collo-cygni]|uniref:F-box domain-containing protein n=1 Tax=Ramularia collo-cygni TaxID=112498 RepID=A0A2D3VCY6_9PEZI|nr:uncharacterized protein RCC_04237 [Ramularia collo-cygni]CZT18393.1 uncharacterized protein RCC_04237 [Ramularia collo-cygni]